MATPSPTGHSYTSAEDPSYERDRGDQCQNEMEVCQLENSLSVIIYYLTLRVEKYDLGKNIGRETYVEQRILLKVDKVTCAQEGSTVCPLTILSIGHPDNTEGNLGR